MALRTADAAANVSRNSTTCVGSDMRTALSNGDSSQMYCACTLLCMFTETALQCQHGLYQIRPALLAFVPWCGTLDVESPFDWASVRPYQEENLDKPDPGARLIAERGNSAVI